MRVYVVSYFDITEEKGYCGVFSSLSNALKYTYTKSDPWNYYVYTEALDVPDTDL